MVDHEFSDYIADLDPGDRRRVERAIEGLREVLWPHPRHEPEVMVRRAQAPADTAR